MKIASRNRFSALDAVMHMNVPRIHIDSSLSMKKFPSAVDGAPVTTSDTNHTGVGSIAQKEIGNVGTLVLLLLPQKVQVLLHKENSIKKSNGIVAVICSEFYFEFVH